MLAHGYKAEDTETGVFNGGVERCGDRESEQASAVGRADDAVVPEPRARVVGMLPGARIARGSGS